MSQMRKEQSSPEVNVSSRPKTAAQSLQFLPIEHHFASSSGTDSCHVIWVISFGLR